MGSKIWEGESENRESVDGRAHLVVGSRGCTEDFQAQASRIVPNVSAPIES